MTFQQRISKMTGGGKPQWVPLLGIALHRENCNLETDLAVDWLLRITMSLEAFLLPIHTKQRLYGSLQSPYSAQTVA